MNEKELQEIQPWERHTGIQVECPACGFCFDSDHTDQGGWYSCPACAELALTAKLAAAEERVAVALYERAMSERRTFSKTPEKFSRGWFDDPYVPPLAEGGSRPTNWRDGWREEARVTLTVVGLHEEREEAR